MVQARKAGAVAIGYTGGYDTADALRDAGARRLIDRLSELVSLIADTPVAAALFGVVSVRSPHTQR